VNFFFLIFAITVPVTLQIDFKHPTMIENPTMALGGAIDGHEKGGTKEMLSSKSVKEMLRAGLKPLAYRLRTELGVEAWHWNPMGTWSDQKNQQGYWTSSTKMGQPIEVSYGYRLPRRGDTLDEANNDGYSRLDDGNPNTFWKSNPYLTSHYTGEPDWKHPQWVILDFGKKVWINAARLHWRDPSARKFCIQYANDGAIYFGNNKPWHDFSHGKISNGCGGAPLLDLGQPHCARYVRILMRESLAMKRGCDPRDQMGYALQEIEIGFLKNGIFQDHVIHRPDQKQTMATVSSTDPWHRACDLDEKTEQPGVDAVATSSLGNAQPILWSLPVLYDTPENAAALVSYLKKQHYLQAHQRLELGEEPDGQHIDPKDFGELYCQVAAASQQAKLKAEVEEKREQKKSKLKLLTSTDREAIILGGPSFVTIDCQPNDTTYRFDHRLWLKSFFQQLRHHHQEKNFQFLTFEWYPFDDLLQPASELLCKQTGSLRRAMNLLRRGGVSKKMPMIITEYGYSVFSGEPEVKMEAALLNAEIVSEFLASGGMTAYLYGYEPNTLECGINNSWGNLMMLLERGESLIPLPTFYGAQMVTDLIKPGREIFPVTTSQSDLTAYAFHQQHPNEWTVLCINKNPTKSCQVVFKNPTAVEKISYSSKNYRWHADGPNGFPSKNEPPQREFISVGVPIEIEPWSLAILKIKKGSVPVNS